MLLRLAESVIVRQKILRVTTKAQRVRLALKCGIREKGVQTPDVLPLSLPSGNRAESGSLSETSYSRSVSTCKRDLSPEAMETPDESSSG